jgi:uncharacterized protein YndB with AHSA1/START domain
MTVRSTVEVNIDAPREKVAALLADPAQSTKWMDDLERVEPLNGVLGTVGSTYRLVPKRGDMDFVATVVAKKLPNEVRVNLDGAKVSVQVTGTMRTVDTAHTTLVSEEIFTFKGLLGKVLGLFAGRAIKRAHRRHIEALKRLAERAAHQDP